MREIIFQILDNTIVKWYYISEENEKMYMQQSLYLKKAMAKQHITQVQLGEKTGQTQKNLSGKLYRNNFRITEYRDLLRAMGCDLEMYIVYPDGEKVLIK